MWREGQKKKEKTTTNLQEACTHAQSLPAFCLRFTADLRVEIILFTTILNSLCTHRCLQESWGQILSMYLNTRKQYEWLHFSEDCLYLNVYAPVLVPGDPLLPVSTVFYYLLYSIILQPSAGLDDLSCLGDGLVPWRCLPHWFGFHL